MTASLPATAPEAAAKRWLQDASDHLGWTSPSLSIHRNAGALRLKLEGGLAVSNPTFTSSRVDLTLTSLAARLGQLSSTPVSLCVRLPGAAVISRSPAPIQEGRVDGGHFLFHQPSATTAGPLAIEFGIPPRWPAVAVVAALLWLAAPFGIAIGVRAYLAQHQSLPPARRISMFDRWMLAARIAAVAGLCATVMTLDLDRLRYFGLYSPAISGGSLLLAPFWFWCQGAAGMVRRGFVREIAPDAPTSSFDAAWCLGTAVLFVLFLLFTPASGLTSGIPGTVPAFGPGTIIAAGPSTSGWLLTVGGVLLFLVFLPVYLLSSRMGRPAAVLTPVDDPAALKVTLRELTEQASRERQEYAENPELAERFAGTTVVNALSRTTLQLDPDQLAALSATAHLSTSVTQTTIRWTAGAACGLAALLIVPGIRQILHPTPGFGSLYTILICGFFCAVFSAIHRRRHRQTHRQLQELDLRIALAMDEPRRYLEALRRLAEVEQFNAVMTNSASGALGFTERARQLERRLYLD